MNRFFSSINESVEFDYFLNENYLTNSNLSKKPPTYISI